MKEYNIDISKLNVNVANPLAIKDNGRVNLELGEFPYYNCVGDFSARLIE